MASRKPATDFVRTEPVHADSYIANPHVDYLHKEDAVAGSALYSNGFFEPGTDPATVKQFFIDSAIDANAHARANTNAVAGWRGLVLLPNDASPHEVTTLMKNCLQTIPKEYPVVATVHAGSGSRKNLHMHFYLVPRADGSTSNKVNKSFAHQPLTNRIKAAVQSTWKQFGREMLVNVDEHRLPPISPKFRAHIRHTPQNDVLSGKAEMSATNSELKNYYRVYREKLLYKQRLDDLEAAARKSTLSPAARRAEALQEPIVDDVYQSLALKASTAKIDSVASKIDDIGIKPALDTPKISPPKPTIKLQTGLSR